MEQKKNHKVNLENKRGVYAAIGLLMASAIVLVALEYRTFVHEIKHETYDPFISEDVVESLIIYVPKAPKKPSAPVKNTNMTRLIIDDPVDEGEIEIVPIAVKSEANLLATNQSLFNEEIIIEDDIPVLIPQVMPEYQGGIKKMYEFLASSIKYPRMALDSRLEGNVYLEFIIEKNGSISNISVIRDEVGGGCAQEAIRVVKQMPKWKPGSQYGKSVRVKFTLPVHFKIK